MNEKLKRCEACDDPFYASDTIIEVNDDLYHEGCISIHPCEWFAMLDGEPLGITENDEGTEAYDMLDEGEYLEGQR